MYITIYNNSASLLDYFGFYICIQCIQNSEMYLKMIFYKDFLRDCNRKRKKKTLVKLVCALFKNCTEINSYIVYEILYDMKNVYIGLLSLLL